MLQVPRLDDLDYQALMDRARAMIPTLTDEWTDLNDHDPGITTLQTFAWLCDGLNYYINATGEQHRLKYLKLLGIHPTQAAASCRVAVTAPDGQPFLLPRGTRLAAGDISFELTSACRGTANRMVRLYAARDGQRMDLTAFAGVDSETAPVFSDDGAPGEFFLGFSGPLTGRVRLFIKVDGGGRNPFADDFSLADLVWECWDGACWQTAETISDETSGLLRSGYLTLQLPCGTAPYEGEDLDSAHYLRCRLTRNEYDMVPRLGQISLNCAQAEQLHTYSEAMEYQYDGTGSLLVDRAVGPDDLISVWLEGPEGYEEYDKFCELEEGELSCLRVIRFDAGKFGTAPAAGQKLLVIVTEAPVAEALVLGETDGCAHQQLEFDAENVIDMRAALIRVRPDGSRVLTLWDRCRDLSQAGCDDLVFEYSSRNKLLTFGDSIHGVTPDGGQIAAAVTVRTSLLDQGNVLEGQINEILQPELENISVVSLEPAHGGVREQESEELEPLIEKKLRTATRAVTAGDIHDLVMATPGLILDSAAVIPMREYCDATGAAYRPNTILVAVKPSSAQPLPILGEVYRRRIREYLEPARLLTTDIRVIPAQYVGVSVFGRIRLTENNPRTQSRVLREIERLADTVSTGEYGRKLDYGRLFSALEMLDCVKNVVQLSLEYIGAGGGKNEHGDILVHPDSLSYLRETGIEFL